MAQQTAPLGLTKESFFNEMTEQFPRSMGHFLKWVNKYKAKVGWDVLFNARDGFAVPAWDSLPPQFDELPEGLQTGIWLAFLKAQGRTWIFEGCLTDYNLADDIEGYFKEWLEPLLVVQDKTNVHNKAC